MWLLILAEIKVNLKLMQRVRDSQGYENRMLSTTKNSPFKLAQ